MTIYLVHEIFFLVCHCFIILRMKDHKLVVNIYMYIVILVLKLGRVAVHKQMQTEFPRSGLVIIVLASSITPLKWFYNLHCTNWWVWVQSFDLVSPSSELDKYLSDLISHRNTLFAKNNINHGHYILFNYRPRLLVEQCRHPVRTRGFLRVHHKKCSFDLFFRG